MPTVLIVDDTPANLAIVVESLETHGLRVVVAQHGQEAMQRTDYVRPDLILLDVMLPGLDGFEVCRRLKANAATRDIPVIFMTSLARVEDKLTGFAVGAVDYVTKPLQVEEVRARVTTHLSLRAMQRQLQDQNARLQQANEELEAFSYSVSHDLRAPLRAISGFASILAECKSRALDREGRDYLDRVIASARRMETLIDDLLNYARTGRGAVRTVPVPLAPLLAQLESTLGERIRAAGVRFEVLRPLATPLGDPTLIAQVLTNLVENALTYRRLEGTPVISVACEPGDAEVLLRVADNGIGIAPENQQTIFQVFHRLHSEAEYPGSGIGLAIVAKAARAMHGEPSVESTPGQGSIFTVRLPAARPDSSGGNHERSASFGT